MSQREELKEARAKENVAISDAPPTLEKPFEHTDGNVRDRSELNLKIKACMARELHSMGVEVDAISRLLRTDTKRVEEWIRH